MEKLIDQSLPKHGVATDAELERLRAKIGQKVTINEPPYLTEVTRDSVLGEALIN